MELDPWKELGVNIDKWQEIWSNVGVVPMVIRSLVPALGSVFPMRFQGLFGELSDDHVLGAV